MFVPSLTAMIGFWATLSLNMPDFTRFGRSQREQIVGQVVALPTTMFVFAAMGVIITSATAIIYGEAIWDPVQLVGRFSSPLVVAVAMFTVVVATVAVKAGVRAAISMSLEQGLRYENELHTIFMSDNARHEGIKAFQEKRDGKF